MQTEITVELFEKTENVIEKLKYKGFSVTNDYFMIDYYFSKECTETLKTLDYKGLIDNSFLVRRLELKTPLTLLIYKNKVLDKLGNVIKEEKYEVNLGELEKTLQIFKASGLNNWLEIKQRLIFLSNETIKFSIQVVDDLGTFIEYEEDESMKNLSEQEKIDTMLKNLKSLNLNIGSDYSCKKTYMKFKKDNNI